jgi:BirA family transcriptional regulator, biotin operon repressor / biotin---[acetyl-CoA-carboxylase] ligase
VAAEVSARTAAVLADSYDGESARSLARRLGLPGVHLYSSIASTMDAAHSLGEAGAPAGTLIVADGQTAGRGRQARPWLSAPTRGVWLTLLERPDDVSGLEVLSLRVGLALARALDPFAAALVQLKWPNDLFVGRGKVAGVLVESRWRAGRPDWIAIGLGVNVRPPRGVPGAAGLRDGTSRIDVITSLIPTVREAAALRGPLGARELSEYAARDYACGRQCITPARGVVVGVTAAGELAVQTARGLARFRTGSLVLEEGA